jgi:hypothetical protein
MSPRTIVAAVIRLVVGSAGLFGGYLFAWHLLDSLQADVSAATWAAVMATDSFATIRALFVTVMTVGAGVLVASVADVIFDFFGWWKERNDTARSPADTASFLSTHSLEGETPVSTTNRGPHGPDGHGIRDPGRDVT